MRSAATTWGLRTTAGFLLALLFGSGGAACAQDTEEIQPLRGSVEFGVRTVVGDRDVAKFREYRHIPTGFFVKRFELRSENFLGTRNYLFVQLRETLERDQRYLAGLGRHGKFRLDFRWEETPHLFTNTAQTLFQQAAPGVYTIPLPIRTDLQTDPTRVPALLQDSGRINVGLARKLGTGSFTLTPTPDWRFLVEYGREKQFGSRPFGTVSTQFTHVVEVPEPIDYRTHRIRTLTEYGNKTWGVQVGYTGSLFHNQISELVWDIPFRTADSATAGPSRSRLDLYPDNSAHNLSIAGAFNLHATTRVMASIVPGWMRQESALLPFTTNPAIPNVPELPISRIDARKQTLAMNYTATSRPISPLSVTARFRFYDYNNDTPSLTFESYVRGDAARVTTPRRTLPYAFKKETLELDAAWEFLKAHSLKLGYGWERFQREHRDLEESQEHSFGGALDSKLHKRLLFRLSYRNSLRDAHHYEPNEESFAAGLAPTVLGQLHELRKFDQAARRRHNGQALLQFDPLDTLSLSASYNTLQDDYPHSLYGVLNNLTFGYSFDATYAPHPSFSVFGEYAREKYRHRLHSRQRTTPAADSSNNDWESSTHDLIDTWTGGLDLMLPRKTTLSTYYSLSAAQGGVRTRALGDSSLPGFLVTAAPDYPDLNNRFHQLVTSLRFNLSPTFSPRIEYRYENWGRVDYQVDPVVQYMFPVDSSMRTSVFLGTDPPKYRTHVLEFTLQYRF